jgi:hypothetical protein
MPPSNGDDSAARRTDAVRREMQRLRTADESDEPDLLDTVGDEQRRRREADDDEDGDGDDD